MTDNNTRTKANAVFFSVLMVISMVAVGFAAVPAAAVATPSITADAPNQVDQDATFDITYTIENTGNETGSFALEVADPSAGVTAENFAGDIQSSAPDDSPATASTSSIDAGTSGTVTVTYNVSADANTGSLDVVLSAASDIDNTSDEVTSTVEVQSSSSGGSGVTVDNRDVASADQAEIDGVSEGDILVTSGNTVFQGEEDITFIDPATNDTFSASALSGTSGNREGTPLQLPIPEDEETGTYDLNGPDAGSGGFSTTVVEPRITTAEVQLNGDDIDQVASTRSDDLDIAAEFNFDEAEPLSITVEDPSGADITDEVASNSLIQNSGDTVSLDLSTEDAGEYTVIFEGDDDLDTDNVVQEYTIETTSQDSVQLEIGEDPVTQGNNVDFTVSGATNNDLHTVAIDGGDLRDEITVAEADDVFRNVDDVENTGVIDADGNVVDPDSPPANFDPSDGTVFAEVEIDGTTAVGSINTGGLDDSTIDVDVFGVNNNNQPDTSESVDDASFEVTEGEITLDSPTDSYIVGSDADINGTAASSDQVAIYARDNNDWEMLDIDEDGDIDEDDFISVDSDDTFEEEDVNLRDARGNILGFEGNYGIGAVSVADLSDNPNEFAVLDNSEFSTASSTRESINVESGSLDATFQTINGQIADDVDDDIDVEGSAAGQDSVVLVFVGERGDVDVQEISVDDDDTFDEDDVSLSAISQGSVSGHVISPGRDGSFGDGGDADAIISDIEGFGSGSSTGDQIRSQIVANTVDEDGSDDLIVSTTFRINDPTLSVNNVYPEAAEASGLNPVATGETIVVEGDTNRQPDNAAITVELLTQNENSVQSVSVDEWENDGQFSVTMDSSDIETGTYIIEADDGESTDRVNVEIVEERQQPDDGEDGEDGADDGEDGADDGDDGSADGDDGSADGDDGMDDGEDGADDGEDGADDGEDGDDGTDDSTPGFGALVALVALVAAALLATRRND